MATWTNMKMNGEVRFDLNALKTHVIADSVYGQMVMSIDELRKKKCDHDIHPVVRKIYQDMLEFWEKNK